MIVDFYLSDQIVRPGGLIVLDDMWMNSIQTATSFLVNNRSYEVVPTSVANITVLRKTRDDDREWTHFNEFEVYGFTPEPTPERPVADAFYPPHEAPPLTEASDFPVGEATTRQSWFTRLGRAFHGLA